jgi:ABC-type phosphate transport system auxiliary subunit
MTIGQLNLVKCHRLRLKKKSMQLAHQIHCNSASMASASLEKALQRLASLGRITAAVKKGQSNVIQIG